MRKSLTLCRREFWESRTGFVYAPLVLAAVLLAAVLLGGATITIGGQQLQSGPSIALDKNGQQAQELTLTDLFSDELREKHAGLPRHVLGAGHSLFVTILLLVLGPYFLGTLFSDRRDRSILFWKSLPVSETRTVLAKLATGLVGAPMMYMGAAVAMTLLTLTGFSLYALVISGLAPGALAHIWLAVPASVVGLLIGWGLMALWFAPMAAWLLFCSALAKRSPFLWATGLPLGLIIAEALLLDTARPFRRALFEHFHQAWMSFGQTTIGTQPLATTLSQSLSHPALWSGLAVAVALLGGCIWLRNVRYEL